MPTLDCFCTNSCAHRSKNTKMKSIKRYTMCYRFLYLFLFRTWFFYKTQDTVHLVLMTYHWATECSVLREYACSFCFSSATCAPVGFGALAPVYHFDALMATDTVTLGQSSSFWGCLFFLRIRFLVHC